MGVGIGEARAAARGRGACHPHWRALVVLRVQSLAAAGRVPGACSAPTAPARPRCCTPWPACARPAWAACGSAASRMPTGRAARWPASGLLAQQQPDHFAASVLETALVGRHPHLGRWDWEGAEDLRITREALAAVGLEGFEARDVLTLRRRAPAVAIAALLVQQPRLYLLDEPSTISTCTTRSRYSTCSAARRADGRRGGDGDARHQPRGALCRSRNPARRSWRRGGRHCRRDSPGRAPSHAFGHPLRAVTDGERTLFIPD